MAVQSRARNLARQGRQAGSRWTASIAPESASGSGKWADCPRAQRSSASSAIGPRIAPGPSPSARQAAAQKGRGAQTAERAQLTRSARPRGADAARAACRLVVVAVVLGEVHRVVAVGFVVRKAVHERREVPASEGEGEGEAEAEGKGPREGASERHLSMV